VLQANGAPPEPERPPWHWVGFGAVAVLASWLVLATIAKAMSDRIVAAKLGALDSLEETAARIAALPEGERWALSAALFGPQMLAVILAGMAGGFLVGRWGANTTLREALLAGVATSGIAGLVTCASAGVSAAPLALFVVLPLSCAAGGHAGIRRRQKLGTALPGSDTG
jgi:hypothetical protein